jgi:glycosyltransferase involved in cell wall biosynthesis
VRVQAFGTYDRRAHPRIGILVDGLTASGVEVVECNVPLGVDTAARVAMLQQPWRLPLLVLRLARCWLSLALRSRRLPAPDALLVGYLGHFDVLLARVLHPRTTIVLDQLVFAADTAADRGVRTGLRPRLLHALDRLAVRAADLVLVDTEENLALVPAGGVGLVVPVGAPDAWFAPARVEPGESAPLRVLFFGLFTPLQGAITIAEAAQLLATETDIEITLVGRGQDLDAARAATRDAPNVHWRDWVAAEDLPAFAAGFDVCLGIFGTGSKALRVVPNKVFQGAAAGCAIVTSDTAPQRRTLGDAAVYVSPGSAHALAAALRDLAGDRVRAGELATISRARAERFRPAQVVAPLVARLAERVSDQSA